MNSPLLSRRTALRGIGGGLALASARLAQPSSPGLPLRNTGLEHYGYTVPDSEAAARFFGRIFDTQLFKEKDPPPRFYVRLGIGYLAFGQHPEVAPFIDHFCALTDGYGRGEARKAMEDAGISFGSGALGMAKDPDGLQFQILGVPGGLAGTIVSGSANLAGRAVVSGDWNRPHSASRVQPGSLRRPLHEDFWPGVASHEETGSRLVSGRKDATSVRASGSGRKAQHPPPLDPGRRF